MKKNLVSNQLKKLASFCGIFSLIGFLSLSSISEENKIIKQELVNGEIDWTNKVVKVKGKANLGNISSFDILSQKRLKALRGARADAYRNLAKIVGEVKVSSEKTIDNFSNESTTTKVQIEGLIKGARQIGEEKITDNSIEVEMFIPLFGNKSLAGAIDLGKYVKKVETLESSNLYYVAYAGDFLLPLKNDFSENPNTNVKTEESSTPTEKTTGLIIDASGFGVEPAMAPFLIAGAKIIYTGGKIDVDPEKVVNYGVTDYADSLENAKKNINRVGINPLIVEARAAVGKPNRTNLLLDQLSVKKILEENDKYKFLNNLAVIIVI